MASSLRSSHFLVVIAAILLVASCAPAAQESPAQSSPQEQSSPSVEPPVPPSAPAAPESSPDQASLGPKARLDEPSAPQGVPLSSDAKKLLARADEKVKGYSFIYAAPPDNLARDTYFVKGDRVKIELYDRGWFKPETHMTHVYLDGASKAAVGVCEDARITYCPDPKKRFQVTYSEYAIKMPYQWLKEIRVGQLSSGDKVFDRMTKKISYAQGSESLEQWIDEYSGLPVKVKVADAQGERLYEFRHLTVNDVSDDVFKDWPW